MLARVYRNEETLDGEGAREERTKGEGWRERERERVGSLVGISNFTERGLTRPEGWRS